MEFGNMRLELNKIYNMDCLEGMKEMEDNSVDCVITDPPYGINFIPHRGLTKSIDNDNLSDEDFEIFLTKIFNEVNRILKDNSFLIIFIGWTTIPLFRKVLDKLFTLKSMPIWIKNNFGVGYYTRPQYEPCFLYMKGNPKPLKKPISDVWKFDKVLYPIHSCQKPVKLMRFIINNFSEENEIIIDPFSGIGSSLIACKQLNRNFIGFEISQEYCDIANKRLKQENLKSFF